MNVITLNTRRHPRRTVEIPVAIQIGDSVVQGTARDLGPGGSFIEPEDGYIAGEFVHGAEVLEFLRDGQDVKISISGGLGYEFCPSLAEIRWTGYSAAHRCHGFGIQWKIDQVRLAA